MAKLIDISNLCVGYDNKPDVLTEVNLTIYDDDFLGVIGPNGGGKTTLLKSILGLIKPQSGLVTYFHNGQPTSQLNIGYLPQINQIDRKFPISVHDVIQSGLKPRKGLFSSYAAKEKQQVGIIAEQLGISHLLQRSIGVLSGGQLQRVLLGRAIVDNPQLLVLDEPSSYVDKLFEKNFYKLLADISQRLAIVLVSHDVGTIIPLVKNIACVNQTLHYHAGSDVSAQWLNDSYGSCPIEILGHGNLPHRVLQQHDHTCTH